MTTPEALKTLNAFSLFLHYPFFINGVVAIAPGQVAPLAQTWSGALFDATSDPQQLAALQSLASGNGNRQVAGLPMKS